MIPQCRALENLILGLAWLGVFLGMNSMGYALHEGIVTPDQIRTTASGIKHLVDLELAGLSVCPDCGYLINHSPRYVPVAEANRRWRDDELVLGVRLNGLTRAYPLRLLQPPRSHIINDVFNGLPLAVTYCPLCFSGVVFERPQIQGAALQFATAGLYKRDLVMYDGQTFSLWQQFTGELLAGSLLGTAGRLHRIPADIVPWGLWKQAHPDTEVLADWDSSGDPSPLALYREIAQGRGRADVSSDSRLPPNAIVVGIVVNGVPKAYLEETIERIGLLNDTVGGVDVLVVRNPESGEIKFFKRQIAAIEQSLIFEMRDGKLVDQQTGSSWSFDGQAISGSMAGAGTKLEEIPGMPAFWFAWATFYPHTELFK